MLLIRPLRAARLGLVTGLAVASRSAPKPAQIRLFTRVRVQHRLPLGNRTFRTPSGQEPVLEVSSSPRTPGNAFGERILVYHAGTGKITFVACLKLTTIFVFAFFGFVITPAVYKEQGLSQPVVLTALCAAVPLVFVAYTTSPFVSFIQMRLPPAARRTRETMQRYLASLQPETEMEITTMSVIGKPRVSRVKLSELVPVNRRFGIVNMARDTAAENASRKWYMFRAVGNFSAMKTTGKTGNPLAWGVIWKNANKGR